MKAVIAKRTREIRPSGMTRGACGIVPAMGAGLRPAGKPAEMPPPPYSDMRRTSIPTPIVSKATLTDAQAADLLAGKYYFNLHTSTHPKRELRGQVERVK